MIVYFADRKLNILGLASTQIPDSVLIDNDSQVIDIDTGVVTFEFDLYYAKGGRLEAEEMTTPGNYVLRKDGEEQRLFQIVDAEADNVSGQINVYAEDAGLDLLGDVVGPYEAQQAMPAASYVALFAAGSDFEIGLNEISDRSRKLSWDGESTATARILSLANKFDAEMGYSFQIEGLRITHKYIDFYAKRGADTHLELRMGKDVRRIRVRRSVANLVTGLLPKGAIPEGEEDPLTLENYSYDDGDCYVDSDGRVLSRTALQKWGRFGASGVSAHIIGVYNSEADTKSSLCTQTIRKLKQLREMEVNYEVELEDIRFDMHIGDTVDVVDQEGQLYLSARLLKIATMTSRDRQEITLGDFLIRTSGISDRVQQLSDQFQAIAKARPVYTWVAYADDASGTGISQSPTNKEYIGIATNRLKKEDEDLDPSVYQWSLIKGADGTPGSNGINGTSNFIHVRYSNDGTTFTANSGKTPGEWIGTAVTETNTAPTAFSVLPTPGQRSKANRVRRGHRA